MRSYTHITGAIVLFLSFAYLTNLNNLLVGILFASWITLFPDILDRLIGKHRGYGHSIIWIIPCLLAAFFNVTIAIALIIGIISHVLLDLITTHGTPILYPLWKTNFVVLNKKRRIKTGTNHDKAVFLALIFLLIPIAAKMLLKHKFKNNTESFNSMIKNAWKDDNMNNGNSESYSDINYRDFEAQIEENEEYLDDIIAGLYRNQ